MSKKQHRRFVVFLDIDGVLNTPTTVKITPDGYKGIDDARVEILANVLQKMGGGDLVLSSDWKEMDPQDDDYQYLVSKLQKYNLRLAGQTWDTAKKRGAGIRAYLTNHPEIEEYVVLDDNLFDFREDKKIWERLLVTDGIEKARCASDSPAVEAILFCDYIKLF